MAQFIQHMQAIVFLLNHRYCPYYKWAQRAMKELPILGGILGEMVDGMTAAENQQARIEGICWLLIRELKRQELTSGQSNFLLDHACCIQNSIADEGLRKTHLMAE